MALAGKACYFKLHGRREKCPECTADKTFTTGKKNSRFGLLEAQPHADEVGYQITCYPLKDSSGGITGIAESNKYANFHTGWAAFSSPHSCGSCKLQS